VSNFKNSECLAEIRKRNETEKTENFQKRNETERKKLQYQETKRNETESHRKRNET
jgi:hypothetical protein